MLTFGLPTPPRSRSNSLTGEESLRFCSDGGDFRLGRPAIADSAVPKRSSSLASLCIAQSPPPSIPPVRLPHELIAHILALVARDLPRPEFGRQFEKLHASEDSRVAVETLMSCQLVSKGFFLESTALLYRTLVFTSLGQRSSFHKTLLRCQPVVPFDLFQDMVDEMDRRKSNGRTVEEGKRRLDTPALMPYGELVRALDFGMKPPMADGGYTLTDRIVEPVLRAVSSRCPKITHLCLSGASFSNVVFASVLSSLGDTLTDLDLSYSLVREPGFRVLMGEFSGTDVDESDAVIRARHAVIPGFGTFDNLSPPAPHIRALDVSGLFRLRRIDPKVLVRTVRTLQGLRTLRATLCPEIGGVHAEDIGRTLSERGGCLVASEESLPAVGEAA